MTPGGIWGTLPSVGASPGRIATHSSRLRPRSPSARRLPAPGPLSRRRSQVSSRADSRGLWWPPRPQPPVGVGAEDLPDPTQPVLTERFPRGLRGPLPPPRGSGFSFCEAASPEPQTPGPWVCPLFSITGSQGGTAASVERVTWCQAP